MINRLKVLFFLFLLLSFVGSSWAQFSLIDSPFDTKIHTILQDSQETIWVASKNSIAQFDGYQFNPIQLNYEQSKNAVQVLTMAFVSENELYIGTKNQGLLSYHLGRAAISQPIEAITNDAIYVIRKIENNIWAVSKHGLYKLNSSGHHFYPFKESKTYIDAMVYQNNQLLIATSNQLLGFEIKGKTFADITYPFKDQTLNIWNLYVDHENNLLISTSQGVFQKSMYNQEWTHANQDSSGFNIRNMISDSEHLWLGTTTQGLIRSSLKGQFLPQHFLTSNSNIVNDSITALFIDQNQNLWVGSYDGSLTLISFTAMHFGLNADTLNFDNCPKSQEIKSFVEDLEGNLWLTTSKEVIKVDAKDKSCIQFKLGQDYLQNKHEPFPYLFQDDDKNIWVNYLDIGLAKIQDSESTNLKLDHPLKNSSFFIKDFITQTDSKTFVFGTSRGLVSYDIAKKQLKRIPSEPTYLQQSNFRGSYPISNNEFLIATTKGLATFDGITMRAMNVVQSQLSTQSTETVFRDSLGNIWVGTVDAGLFKFNERQELVKHFISEPEWQGYNNINNLLEDGSKRLWVSAGSRLIRLDIVTNQTLVFDHSDGLQNKLFSLNSGYKSPNGKMYFAGTNGYNAFYPDNIAVDQTPPPIILTRLSRFNKSVEAGVNYDGFQINNPINFINEITLSHKDYVMGFEFAALDYAAPDQNQYAYMLEGFDPDWNYVDANNRKATYTDLPSGDYTFKVKGSNKYGVWNEQGKSLAIRVNPAPWFSWWAWLSYAVMFVLAVALFIKKKIQDSKKQAALLKVEVDNKTRELKVQKQRVESLLVKKNELFSNVSHEFRTPLTLILGPIKELINQGHNAEGVQSLNVINRNANRLLSLVEQLLQLARVSDTEKVSKSTQKTASQVQSVVDSFEHMAHNKKLKLHLLQNENAHIHVTDQCLDAIMGNLISNAIKYTQIGGQVDVTAEVEGSSFVLKVKDTGAGLTEEQQKDIFKRFKRLDSHQEIEGIGIGLAVVEEVVKINQGHIEVISEVGVGSEFIVTLPLSASIETTELSSNHSLVNQLASELPTTGQVIEIESDSKIMNDSLNQVLVIEDNQDMRNHIVSIIKPHYNTITAKHGKEGVALAIEHIPDLIICDVMMPEMDGFKVSRIIRSDERTSHIPLILLTALNDKTSRIKGWREHVDAYMTKPFDRDELLVQLENMLTIRDILKKKTGQSVLSSEQGSKNEHITLPKKDQQFLNKLMKLIEELYPDPMLTLTVLAGKMAVSDRQLQRKLKALTDQNPTDLLREFRLKKASELLKDGYQVSQIADNCGFNSVSYFSSCFKAQYGMPPKKYQQMN